MYVYVDDLLGRNLKKTFNCDSLYLSNFHLPLHFVGFAEIWHEVLLYGPNPEMDIKKFQFFLLAKKRESALGLPILAL